PAGSSRRSRTTPGLGPLARRNRQRALATGHLARVHARARSLLARGLRLAQARRAPQQAAALPHRDRWTWNPLRPPAGYWQRSITTDRDSRVAEHVRRAHAAVRHLAGVRPCASLATGIRLLRHPLRTIRPSAGARALGGTNAPARLRTVRGSRRRSRRR